MKNTAHSAMGAPGVSRWAVPLLAATLLVGAADAQTLILDPFTDGDRTNGADPNDVAWYQATTDPTLTVGSVPEFGTGNSLLFDSAGTFRRSYVPFSETLLSVGQTLTLSFDLRVVSPTTNSAAFRFGLYNQEVDFISADGQDSRTADDFGWANTIGIMAAGLALGYEPAGNTILGGASPSGIIGIPGATVTATDLGVGTNRTLVYSIQRASASSGTATILLDSVQIATGTRTGLSDANFTFDLLAVGSGSANLDMRLDNVQLTVIPEPASAALVLLAGGLVALRRRRHR